ncbi:ABC transporter permease [Streptomyces candidus]|uniref:Putative ABC transport system permease protein n=1 Tax=Streptomyces candidus TaxID=67283 RepID=A0A7X0LPE5_9ACTN|nr:FtsX-like permease family protein [Streptomyces candidus]MBB6435389.1 putative ABC transport system permease protein [Streptomyces candidus]GHH47676.1 ABC transporter [Streptomyces candidus]
MFRTALRNVLAHKARLLMTVLAVMLGVAFVSGTLIYSDTLHNAFRQQSSKGLANVAVGVTDHGSRSDAAEKRPGLSQAQLDKIAALPGADTATGVVSGFAGAADRDGKLIAQGWSNRGGNFFPGEDGQDRRYTFTGGHGPAGPGEIALDRGTADKGGYKVGDKVRVATNRPVKEYTLSGVFTSDQGDVNAGGSLVLFDTRTAQELFLKPGYFESATVTGKPGADQEAMQEAIIPLVSKDATVQTGRQLAADEERNLAESTKTLTQILLGFAGIALFVGVFLISNTFTMLVAQRTKELALMRAVGASRKQITRSILAEAGIVGLIASVIGFALGLGMAAGLSPLMDAMEAQLPSGPLIVGATPVLASLAVGVLITMFAAWLPARRAAKIPPVAAMSSVHATPSVKSLVVRNVIGALVTGAGAATVVGGAALGKDTGRMLIGGGAFLALIGVIILIPLLSRPVIALVRPLLDGVFKVSGKLAGLNSVRNPRRTGATASALAIGLTLVTGLTVLGVTMGRAIDKQTTDVVKADYMVTMANQSSMDKSVIEALAGAKGVTASSPQQFASLEGSDDSFLNAVGVTPGDVERVLNLKVVEGSLSGLARGEIAIDEKAAASKGYRVGQTLDMAFEDGTKTKLTIGGIYGSNEFVSGAMIDTGILSRHTPEPLFYSAYVAMDGGPTAANEQSLVDSLGKNPAIVVMDSNDIRNQFGGIVNQMLNIMYGLLAMALIIAVLGVVNTLAMSVFERQQEIGMLRAIGLARSKVKTMIRLEAVVISVFGAVVGVVLGTFLAWAIGQTVKDQITGYSLVVPWDRIGIFLLLAAVVGVLAAMWPARSAARLNMLSAIKAE